MKFLNAHGMELVDVERVDIQNGSIVGTVQHIDGPYSPSDFLRSMIHDEKERQIDKPSSMSVFSDKLETLKAQAQDIIKK